MKLLTNKWPVVVAVVTFVLIALFLYSKESRGSELEFEAGSAMVRGETPVVGLAINFPLAGPVNTDYEVGFLLSATSTEREDNPNAFTLYGLLVDGWKKFEMGMGFAYTTVEWEYTCQTTFALMARYRFTDRVAAQWRHFSSGGSCDPNAGRDFATVSWRF